MTLQDSKESERAASSRRPNNNVVLQTCKALDCLGLLSVSMSLDYNTKQELGEGGLAKVWSVYDRTLGREVAIKTLSDDRKCNLEYIERIICEARATAQLTHPNIVPIYSLGVNQELGVFIAMKKLDGDTLRNILRQLYYGNPDYIRDYPTSRLINIYLKICQGVAYAHSKGVIHRDLKPENILVGEYGEVTIIDWGLVRKFGAGVPDIARSSVSFAPKSTKDTAGLEQTDEHFDGTPRYMAPEQIVGRNDELDSLCDIYALGVIMYEMMTLRNPFISLREEKDVLDAVTNGCYLRPRQLPTGKHIKKEYEAICLKAMSLDKKDRYTNVQDIVNDIYSVRSHIPISVFKPSLFDRLRNYLEQNPIKSAILIGILVATATASLTSYLINSYGEMGLPKPLIELETDLQPSELQ